MTDRHDVTDPSGKELFDQAQALRNADWGQVLMEDMKWQEMLLVRGYIARAARSFTASVNFLSLSPEEIESFANDLAARLRQGSEIDPQELAAITDYIRARNEDIGRLTLDLTQLAEEDLELVPTVHADEYELALYFAEKDGGLARAIGRGETALHEELFSVSE